MVNSLLQITRVLNFFVIYGDTFLVHATVYDYLYYELIRQHELFLQLERFGTISNQLWTNKIRFWQKNKAHFGFLKLGTFQNLVVI